MSVPTGKRTHGQLEAITKARALRQYTIQICSNENSFPKRYRWCITNEIIKDTNELVKLLITANAVKVENESDKLRRSERQKMALELTESILDDIDCAYNLFHIKSDRIDYWTGELMNLQTIIRAWMRSDKERYKDVK